MRTTALSFRKNIIFKNYIHRLQWNEYLEKKNSTCVHSWSVGDCFFFAETFRSFLLRHFGHLNILVICLTVVSKLTITVFFSLYFQTF